MAILNKLTWIDSAALTRFILSAQVRANERTDVLFVPFLGPILCLTNEMIYDRTPRVEESQTGRAT